MDYLNDNELMYKLEWIGHDIDGYLFTKASNESSYEKGKWGQVLETRLSNLNTDICSLIRYIKSKY